MRAPQPGPSFETPEAAAQLTVDLAQTRRHEPRLGDEHEIRARPAAALQTPERLPEQPSSAVAFDGSADPTAHDETEPVQRELVRDREQDEERTVETGATSEDAVELRSPPEALAGSEAGHGSRLAASTQAARRRRPFCRRRFNTVWPPLVRIRTKNPCLRRRRRLFGWNVLFMDDLS